MTPTPFQLNPGETILFQTSPQRTGFLVVWKVLSNLLGLALLVGLLYIFLSGASAALLGKFLPPSLATLLSQILFLGLLPLLGLAWVIEDTISTSTSEFLLTDQRIWVKGSPYAWSQGETPLDDVASFTFRREGIFVRRKSTRKLVVYMVPEGKLIVEIYEEFIRRQKPRTH